MPTGCSIVSTVRNRTRLIVADVDSCGNGSCLNTVETGDRSCDNFKRAALALGSASGITTSQRTNTPFQASTSSSSTRPTSSSMSVTATGSSASPTFSRPSSAATRNFGFSAEGLVGAGVTALLAVCAAVAVF